MVPLSISTVGEMVKRRLKRLLRDKSGAAAVVMAMTLPVVLGGMGLGTEVGYWYFNQRKVQNAADMAAYAGAVELRAGNSVESMETAAASPPRKLATRPISARSS